MTAIRWKRWSPCSAARAFSAATWCARWRSRATASGWRCAGRDLAGHLQPLGRVGQIHAVQANLRYPDFGARRPCATPMRWSTWSASCSSAAASVLMPCRPRAPRRSRWRRPPWRAQLVHVSAIGADADSPSHYARTKARGREARRSPRIPTAVILRPSILFGPEDNFFNRFAAMARVAPALPLIGGGRNPVPAGIRRRCRARGASPRSKSARSRGSIYELGGPEVRSFKELMQFVLATIERRRLLVPLPFPLAKLQASFLQLLPKPLLTPDQVELLRARQRGLGRRAKRKAARLRRSASSRSRWKAWCRPICGGSARPGSSGSAHD